MLPVKVPLKIAYDMNANRPKSLFFNDNEESHQVTNTVYRMDRRKKKRRAADAGVKKFNDLYVSTGESLGEGAFGRVKTFRNIQTEKEFAVKVIEKGDRYNRTKVLKEIEIFHHCQGHENILQLVEFFEEDDWFYLVFEKMEGGTLLDCILQRGHLTEQEASLVVKDIARGLSFLHKKGIAHRDLKPENILCVKAGQLTPVKICDFDLGSGVHVNSARTSPVTTPELLSPVGSADFMAPEVVDVWVDQAWSYDKRCDLWSLGIILYILLSGYRPFYGDCGEGCDFSRGQPCDECQDLLFQSIQDGVYTFPDREWSSISCEAKHLISHLLVKNPYERYSAQDVLHHPWIQMKSSELPLATPAVLSRNNSVRELGMFAETANAVNRLISITEACGGGTGAGSTSMYADDNDSSFKSLEELGRALNVHDDAENTGNGTSPFHPETGFQFSFSDNEDDDVDAGIAGWSDDDVDDEENERDRFPPLQPAFTIGGLSPPGESTLAKRRAALKTKRNSISSIDSGNVSGCSPPGIDQHIGSSSSGDILLE